jgi:hypothetical protein
MRGLILGAIAGAAGTMALDIAGYADMAVRGRGSSGMPAEVIRRLAGKVGIASLGVPSDDADSATKNRRSALGALAGYKIGIMLGAIYGAASYPSSQERGILLRSLGPRLERGLRGAFLAGIQSRLDVRPLYGHTYV